MSSTENNNLNATVETGIDHDSLARIDSITDAVGHSKGPVLNGGYTDDLQPTLSGRLPMGEGQVLRVFCNNVVIGYADIGDDATWSFTPDTPLEPGRTYDFQIILLDSGTSELLPSDTYTIHTTELNQDAAPVAPVITEVLDQSGDHQGVVTQGGKTDDSQPLVSGTADAGSVVTVKVYSALHNHTYTLGSVVADADGHWNYQMHGSQDITNGLGEWTFTATATNSMGISDSSAGYSVETVATNADVFATPEISYIIDDVGLHTGQVTDGGKTDDTQPELHGTGEPGSVVIVTMYGPITGKTYTLGHVTVGNDGTWHYQFTGKQGMQAGHGAENIFHVSSVDTDGHTVTSDAFTVTLTGSNADDNTPPDITPPDAPVITEVYDDVGTQQGPVANGGSTDDSQLKISGTAEHDSIVVISHVVESTGAIYVDGSVVADASGHWVFEMTGPFQPSFGNRIITATATDAAGNTSEPSDSFVVNFVDTNQDDITPPDQPTIDSFHDDAGNSLSGATTDDATPTLQGHAEANSIVNVYEGDTLLGSTIAGADGTWSYTTPERADGMHDFTVTATDAAGNISVPSADFVVIIDMPDNSLPAMPVITELLDNTGLTVGPVTNGGKTDSSKPLISGTSDPDAYININVVGPNGGHYTLGQVQADDSGHWSFQMTDARTLGINGEWTFRVQAVDKDLHKSDWNSNFSVEHVAPNMDGNSGMNTPTIDSFHDDAGAIPGDFKTGTNTSDTTPTLQGHAEANSIVNVYERDTLLGSTTAKADGTWSYTTPERADGMHDFTVTATDAAGNTSAHSADFVVNVVSEIITMVTPTIDSYHDDAGASFGSGTYTDDRDPTLHGHAQAGSIVRVYIDNGREGTAIADADGNWQYTPKYNLLHTHVFTVDSVLQGNLSDTSEKFVINIEPQPESSYHWDFNDETFQGWSVLGEHATSEDGFTNSITTNQRAEFRTDKRFGKDYNGDVMSTKIYVEAGKTYDFSYQYGHITDYKMLTAANVGLTVDGQLVGGYHTATDAAQTITGSWTAKTSGEITLAFNDKVSTGSGNDFWIDNISAVQQGVSAQAETQALTLSRVQTEDTHTDASANNANLIELSTAIQSPAHADITDHVQNTLHLTLSDILSEAHPNLFVQDGKQQLAVTGDQGDVVELKVEDITHAEWQDSGAVTAGGIQYEVYQHAGSDVELLVQHGLELHQVS